MDAIAGWLRRLEYRFGIDRQGRSVWVWLIPIASGVIIGVLFGILPGIPIDADWSLRLSLAMFGLVATAAVSVICMLSFDRDRNQEGDDTVKP